MSWEQDSDTAVHRAHHQLLIPLDLPPQRPTGCDVLPESHPARFKDISMDASKRNLLTGLVGVAILLIGILVFAQVNAARNSDLGEYAQPSE